MRAPHLSRRLVLLFAMYLGGCADGNSVASVEQQPANLVLNAAPQDGQVFLTWNRAAHSNNYVLYWAADGSDWQQLDAGLDGHAMVTQLQNGRNYHFVLQELRDGVILSDAYTTQIPQPRLGCSLAACYGQVACFCSQADASEWLQQKGLDPMALTCRNRPIERWGPDVPNCLYKSTVTEDSFLLLRSIDRDFEPRPPRATAVVRDVARRALWPQRNPFDEPQHFPIQAIELPLSIVGNVTKAGAARSYEVTYHFLLSSRITRFTSENPVPGRYAIYHEGHGGAAVDIGAGTIDWLLDRGWEVVAIDMPLIGANSEDRTTQLDSNRYHDDFDELDHSTQSPVALFMLPVKAVVDLVLQWNKDPAQLNLMMVGRSGGGWSTYVYAALDPRIELAVSVAGGVPLSQRLRADTQDILDIGDYEQSAPHLYDVAPHEELMAAAGSRGSLYIHNRFDTCCYRLKPDDPLVSHLPETGRAMGKTIKVYVDEENRGHSIGSAGYAELESFIELIF
jgi:pimeloyl-ACP methyl ester carboxylesterase